MSDQPGGAVVQSPGRRSVVARSGRLTRATTGWFSRRRRLDGGLVEITLRMPPWMRDELRRLAGERQCTVTEHIRRCVAIDKLIWDHHGGEPLVRDADGELIQLTALPSKRDAPP